jgi:hypothetical protein
VKLERLGSNAAQALQLIFNCGDLRLCLGAGLERSQQEYQVGNCF